MTQRVRKAVIPVAGYGTRFLPATKALPKEMLPIIDTPAVQYTVEQVVEAGITDVIFVTGASKRAIEDHFDANGELEARLVERKKFDSLKEIRRTQELANIIYVRQPRQLGDGHAALMAEAAVGSEPFLYLFPDEFLVSAQNPIREMLAVYDEYQAPTIGVYKVPRKETHRYGIIKPKHIRQNVYEVLDLIQKPSVNRAPSRLAVTKGYVLPPNIFGYIKRLRYRPNHEIALADAVRRYNAKHAVFACELTGERYDVGSKIGWMEANIAMALRRRDLRTEIKRFLHQQLGQHKS